MNAEKSLSNAPVDFRLLLVPGRNRRNDTNGSCHGVDDIGKLSAGNAIRIGNRTHNGADRETIEIVINKDEGS